MEHCRHRPRALRALVVALVVLVTARFAFQMRDDGFLQEAAQQTQAGRFVADAFPIAEAGVVNGR